MSIVVEVWSDLHCPWATTVVHRLLAARDRLGLDVVFDPRPWPLEWVNGRGTPRHVVEPETAVLANHEPGLFSRFGWWAGEAGQAVWPSTFLPAFELVAAARRVGGASTAEQVDYALRRHFFTQGRDVSVRIELERCLREGGVEAAEEILRRWERGDVRADVVADYERSKTLPIQGSPQVFWPDGSTAHNPGIEGLRFDRGLPRFDADRPEAIEALLREHCA